MAELETKVSTAVRNLDCKKKTRLAVIEIPEMLFLTTLGNVHTKTNC